LEKEEKMGIGMQIVYLGFPGEALLEGEAAAQLVRLTRFGKFVSNCHLAVEAVCRGPERPLYDVRLDLISPAHDLRPMAHCSGPDPGAAIRCAFDLAEKELEVSAATGRAHGMAEGQRSLCTRDVDV
jgi:hypothetical protein